MKEFIKTFGVVLGITIGILGFVYLTFWVLEKLFEKYGFLPIGILMIFGLAFMETMWVLIVKNR